MPKQCPSCEQKLSIEKLRCMSCATVIEGDFMLPRLARLNKEDQNFVELLVLSDGSLKTMAQRLKVSYPTIRKKLDELIERLSDEIKSDERKAPASGKGQR